MRCEGGGEDGREGGDGAVHQPGEAWLNDAEDEALVVTDDPVELAQVGNVLGHRAFAVVRIDWPVIRNALAPLCGWLARQSGALFRVSYWPRRAGPERLLPGRLVLFGGPPRPRPRPPE